jgi:mannose-1-phosphate guanylyltransferase
MAGGVGSRFWPISTQRVPKQFLDILNTGQSLLQLTFERVNQLIDTGNILVVTNAEYAELVSEHLPDLPVDNILTEPVRRNTAPCIAYAAFKIMSKDPNASMVVTPSDHFITNEGAYLETLQRGLAIAHENDFLITLGITPIRPETGYGYIQYRQETLEVDHALKKVKTFTEKPDAEHAKAFIESGDFLWNSGIFIWNVNSCLSGLKSYLPDVFDTFQEGTNTYNSPEERDFINTIYPRCENISIDYGLMEKAPNVYVLPASFGWSDLGTWSSIQEHLQLDQYSNAISGNKVLLTNSTNSLVVNTGAKLIVADGLDGYVIAEGDQAILIYPKEKEQELKSVVNDVRIKWGEDYV